MRYKQPTDSPAQPQATLIQQRRFLALVLIGAVFLLEYVSYAIAMTESVWLFRRIMQKRWGELKITAAVIGIVALLLIIGAVVETYALSIPL